MKDTACKDCPFLKMGFPECPNYIETLWYQEGEVQPVIVKDCAPKRSLLMLHELHGRVFGCQKQINQAENEIVNIRGSVNKLYDGIRYMEENRLAEKDIKNKLSHHLKSMKGSEPYQRIEEQ